MARIRADYVYGTTTAALASGDTTLSSSSLARLPAVVSPDIAAITLHDSTAGTYEIVHVTAHTAAATTATILRGREGSTAAAWPSGTTWLHGITAADALEFAASGGGGATPVVKGRVSGSITVAVSASYADLDTALDLDVAASAGEWIALDLTSGLNANTNATTAIDMATTVAGSAVNYISGAGASGTGVQAWTRSSTSATITPIGGTVYYQVVSGDISGGYVKFRLRGKSTTATSSLFAQADRPLQVSALNISRSAGTPTATNTTFTATGGLSATNVQAALAELDTEKLATVRSTVLLRRTTNLSLAHDTVTAVPFDDEGWDTDGFHDNATNPSRITIPTGRGGKYLLQGTTQHAASSGMIQTRFHKNGALISPNGIGSTVGAAGGIVVSHAAIADLAAGDYVELYTYQASGSAANLTSTMTSFTATLLGT